VAVTRPNGALVFSWTPACPVGLLIVSFGGDAWIVQSDSNRILPPVRYGQKPGGAQIETSGPVLLSGDICVVSVSRWYTGGFYRQAGVQTFTY